MTTRLIKGNKQQIAQELSKLEGDVREAIVFIEEPADAPKEPVPETVEEMFKEMEPYMVSVGHVDDSREAIYTRQPGD